MELTNIPLSNLHFSPRNVRSAETYTPEEIDALASSISEIGMINNLAVIEADGGYQVVGGGRRLRALIQLLESGEMTPNAGIACVVVPADDAEVISTAENLLRKPMTILEEYRAYAAAAKTSKVSEIARAFGVTEAHVTRQLRLANVHPEIQARFEEGQITPEALTAFAATPDQDKQIEYATAIEESTGYYQPSQIRAAMLDRPDRTVQDMYRVVSEDYAEAGGAMNADLFSAHEEPTDTALIHRLYDSHIETVAKTHGEGWRWWAKAEDVEGWENWTRVSSQIVDTRTLEEIERANELAEIFEANDELSEEQHEEYDLLEQKECTDTWPDRIKEFAGVVVVKQWQGHAAVAGVIKPMHHAAAVEAGVVEVVEPEADEIRFTENPAWLSQELGEMRVYALRCRLAEEGQIAQDVLCDHILGDHQVISWGFNGGLHNIPWRLRAEITIPDWMEPGDGPYAGLADTSTPQRRADRNKVIARGVALKLVNHMSEEKLIGLETRLKPRIRDVWTPGETYFSALRMARLIDLCAEQGVGISAKAKKTEIVAQLVDWAKSKKGKDWLPEELVRTEQEGE